MPDIAGSYINIDRSNISTNKSKVRQLIDIVQTDIASVGQSTRKSYEVFVSGANVCLSKFISSGEHRVWRPPVPRKNTARRRGQDPKSKANIWNSNSQARKYNSDDEKKSGEVKFPRKFGGQISECAAQSRAGPNGLE